MLFTASSYSPLTLHSPPLRLVIVWLTAMSTHKQFVGPMPIDLFFEDFMQPDHPLSAAPGADFSQVPSGSSVEAMCELLVSVPGSLSSSEVTRHHRFVQ